MRNKLILKVACILAVLTFFTGTFPICAASEAHDLACGILDRNIKQSGVSDIQSWINTYLTENAGVSSEWYIISLKQYGNFDMSSYEAALETYLKNNEILSASSRLKYALALLACGSDSDYIEKTLDDSIGKQGIMSYVYGLHLLNNGCESTAYTSDAVIKHLLSLQLSDGGFALTGTAGDVDITAMVVQALAPHYPTNDPVKSAVDNALVFLSNRQMENGGYTSYGMGNPESSAQVLTALSSLGINCTNDARFIKNGNTLFDGISKYRLSDGSFCHKEGGASNENATAQVFYAMIAYIRMANGKGPLFVLDAKSQAPDIPLPDTDTDTDTEDITPPDTNPNHDITPPKTDPDNTTTAPNKGNETSSTQSNYKLPVCLIVIGIGSVTCLVLFIVNKRHFKNFVFVIIIVAAVITLVCVTDFKTTSDYYNGKEPAKEHGIGTVTLAIRCDTVAGISDSEYIPKDGIILNTAEFIIEEGDTVYDILTEAARKYHIQVENNGSAEMAYIAGINYLYEYDFGDLSGWVYQVNGSPSSLGCSEYILSDGDVILWHYTLSLGNDIT